MEQNIYKVNNNGVGIKSDVFYFHCKKSAESCDNVSLMELVVVEEVDSFRAVSWFSRIFVICRG